MSIREKLSNKIIKLFVATAISVALMAEIISKKDFKENEK